MQIQVHDSFGHISDMIAGASSPHGQAWESRLLRHISNKSGSDGEHEALIEALTGRDAEAVRIATETNAANGDMLLHDAGIIEMLARTCGGINAEVAVALIPWFGDESSIEGEDRSGMAWQDGHLVIDPVDGQGVHFHSDGTLHIWITMPDSVCMAAAGRRFGDVVELPLPAGDRIIAEMSHDEGETFVRLAA